MIVASTDSNKSIAFVELVLPEWDAGVEAVELTIFDRFDCIQAAVVGIWRRPATSHAGSSDG
jgi:hypothetical protein